MLLDPRTAPAAAPAAAGRTRPPAARATPGTGASPLRRRTVRRLRTLAMAAALAAQCGVLLTFVGERTVPALVGILGVGALLGIAASVDLDEQRIPNQILTAAAVVVLAVTMLSGGDVLADVALGAALAFIPVAVVLLTRGIGMGDVKMAAVLGAAGGLLHPIVGLATVFLMALSTGIVGLITRWKRLALGPWLWGAFLVASSVAAIVLRAEVRP